MTANHSSPLPNSSYTLLPMYLDRCLLGEEDEGVGGVESTYVQYLVMLPQKSESSSWGVIFTVLYHTELYFTLGA